MADRKSSLTDAEVAAMLKVICDGTLRERLAEVRAALEAVDAGTPDTSAFGRWRLLAVIDGGLVRCELTDAGREALRTATETFP